MLKKINIVVCNYQIILKLKLKVFVVLYLVNLKNNKFCYVFMYYLEIMVPLLYILRGKWEHNTPPPPKYASWHETICRKLILRIPTFL